MKTALALTGTLSLLCGALWLKDTRPAAPTVEVRLQLIDAETGDVLPGLIQLTDEQEKPVDVPELLSRGIGLSERLPIARWQVLPGAVTVTLPRRKLMLRALSGLETETAQRLVDLSNVGRDIKKGNSKVGPSATITLRLKRFYNARLKGLRSGNTHLHLRKISRQLADRYLREIPKADGLDLVFLSYAERAGADRDYISNQYRRADLAALSRQAGVLLDYGEEHRHNFTGYQGYGHVMLLNIQRLVLPVSIGPGIMKTGTDGIPLRRGIETARQQGASIIWCHDRWGLEAVPNWLAGRIDAQNIFDGGTHGSYKDSFYLYLNAGLRVPFSTGTDWFQYDFSRVYCDVSDLRAGLTVGGWLQALTAGRSYITNGPLLEFEVEGKSLGDTVALRKAGPIRVRGRAVGRSDFGRIELIRNGKVIAQQSTRQVGGHYEAAFSKMLTIDGPCWLAVRTPPPPLRKGPEYDAAPKNELGRNLFAHTSPVYVTVAGKSYFNPEVARFLLRKMKRDRQAVLQRGKFADAVERAAVLDVYADSIALLKKRLEQNR